MRRFPAGIGLLSLTVATAVALPATGAAGGDGPRPAPRPVADEAEADEAAQDERWVHTWVSMPQLTEPNNMPPAPFNQSGRVMANATLRQTVRVTIGGQRIRLRFSNVFGGAALPITAASVALPAGGRAGVSAIQPGTAKPVTFNGQPSVSIPAGAQVLSDPLDFPVVAGSNLAVTIYLSQGQASNNITSHPGSRTTSYLLSGNHVADADLPGATRTDHWYFLHGVELVAGQDAAGVVVLGDSLTDGRGSTTNVNNRWPDRLFDRLQTQPDTAWVAVLNQGAGGNRVLNDGLGPSALSRFDRDVLGTSGVTWLIIFEGVNDIGTAAADQGSQRQVASQLIAAYQQMIAKARAQDIVVYGATLLPFGGNSYDDAGGVRESARQTVNSWIRTSGAFDAILDFDRAVRDPAQPRRLAAAYDEGDHLHLNPAGYQALADAVPHSLLTGPAVPPTNPPAPPRSAVRHGGFEPMITTMPYG